MDVVLSRIAIVNTQESLYAGGLLPTKVLGRNQSGTAEKNQPGTIIYFFTEPGDRIVDSIMTVVMKFILLV